MQSLALTSAVDWSMRLMHATCSKVCGAGNLSTVRKIEPVHGRRQRAKQTIPALSWGPWLNRMEVFICQVWYNCVKKQWVKIWKWSLSLSWNDLSNINISTLLKAVRTSHAEIEHQEESLPEVLKRPLHQLLVKHPKKSDPTLAKQYWEIQTDRCCPCSAARWSAVRPWKPIGETHQGWHPWTQISPGFPAVLVRRVNGQMPGTGRKCLMAQIKMISMRKSLKVKKEFTHM